jgi:hypothetical protein
MQDWQLFASLPFWAIFVGTLVVVLLAVEGGYSWARHRREQSANEREREKEAAVGAMVGTVLGLLALLLAFTFAKAADHYHDRRVALFDEAAAIRTMYSRTALIAEPQRTEVRKILRDHVEDLLAWTGSDKTRSAVSSSKLLDQLSTQAIAIWEKNPSPQVVSLIVGGANDVVRLNAERVEVNRNRIPLAIWAVLYFIAVVSLGAMGYHCGVTGTTRSPVMLGVGIVFSLVIVLIVDLDRPGDGWIIVPQDAMTDLRKALMESKP